MRAMRRGRRPLAARNSGSSRRLVSALRTRTCSVLPKTEQSSTPGRLLQRRQRRPERVAFHQQQFAAERGLLELRRTADGDQTSMIDQRRPVAVLGFVHVMGRDQDRHAVAGEAVDEVPEAPPRRRLDARGRLVQEQDGRPVQHGAAKRQALLPAARKRSDQRLLAAVKPRHARPQSASARQCSARGTP